MTRQASDAAERALWEGDQGDASVGGEFFDSVRGEFDKEEMKRRNNTNGMRRSLMMGMRMKLRSPKQPQQEEHEQQQEQPSISSNDIKDNNKSQKSNRRAVFRLRALRRKKRRGSRTYVDPSLHAISTAGESTSDSYQNELPNQPQSFNKRQQQGRRRQQEDYCLKEQEPTTHAEEENAGNVAIAREEGEGEEEDAVRDSIRSCRRDVAGHNLMVRMGGVRRFSVTTAEDEDESQRSEWLPRSIRPVPPTILERAVSDLTEIPHEYENPRKRLQQAHFTRQVGFRGLGKDVHRGGGGGGGADDDVTDENDWSSTDSSQQSADYPYSPRPRHLPLDIELVQQPSLDNVPSTFTREDDEILKRLGPPSKKLSLISDDGSEDTVTLPDAFVFGPPPTAAPAAAKTKTKAKATTTTTTTTSTTMRNSTMGLSSPDFGQHSLDPVINEDTSMEFGLPKRVGGQILEPEHAVRDWRSAVRKEQQQQQQQQESGSSSILVVNQPTPKNLVVAASQFSIHPRRKKLQHVRVSQLTRVQPQQQKQQNGTKYNNVHEELVWEPSVVVANQSDSEDDNNDYDLDEILAAAAVAQSTASFNRVQSDGVQPMLPPRRTNHNRKADANEAGRLVLPPPPPPPDKATPPPPPKLSPRLQEDASPSFSMRVPSRSGRHSLTIGTSSS